MVGVGLGEPFSFTFPRFSFLSCHFCLICFFLWSCVPFPSFVFWDFDSFRHQRKQYVICKQLDGYSLFRGTKKKKLSKARFLVVALTTRFLDGRLIFLLLKLLFSSSQATLGLRIVAPSHSSTLYFLQLEFLLTASTIYICDEFDTYCCWCINSL